MVGETTFYWKLPLLFHPFRSIAHFVHSNKQLATKRAGDHRHPRTHTNTHVIDMKRFTRLAPTIPSLSNFRICQKSSTTGSLTVHTTKKHCVCRLVQKGHWFYQWCVISDANKSAGTLGWQHFIGNAQKLTHSHSHRETCIKERMWSPLEGSKLEFSMHGNNYNTIAHRKPSKNPGTLIPTMKTCNVCGCRDITVRKDLSVTVCSNFFLYGLSHTDQKTKGRNDL